MPKVTDAYLEAKKEQILEAAAACFAKNGFHQTTMQDICREAKLSAGAVYRYFSGKEEIIETIVEGGRRYSEAIIQTARALPETHQVLNHLADNFFAFLDNPDSQTAIRTEINIASEALRDPRVLDMVRLGFDMVRTSFADIVGEAQKRGDMTSTLDPDAVARVLISLYRGLMYQKAIDPNVDVKKYVAVVKSLKFVEPDNVDETPKAARKPERSRR